jgi:transcriptional regulator of acetoin/glycerol metabolism
VWLRAQLKAHDGVRGAVAVAAPALAPAATAEPPAAAPGPAPHAATLGQHTREVIERTLHEHGGNISHAARVLGVSRGLLYRRMKGWSAPS